MSHILAKSHAVCRRRDFSYKIVLIVLQKNFANMTASDGDLAVISTRLPELLYLHRLLFDFQV